MSTGMLLTEKGVILHGKVQLGADLEFTKVEIGSGQLTEGQDVTELTALIDQEMTLAIQTVTLIGDGKAQIRCTATNTGLATGFYLREVGIFATDPDDGEILYAVANFGDEADYFPAENGPIAVEHQIDSIIIIGNAASVTITVNSEALISQLVDDFAEHKTLTPIDHPDGSVVDAAIGTRTIDDTVTAAAGAGLLGNLLNKIGYMLKTITGKDNWWTAPATTLEAANTHITDTSNPHATTAAQVAALPIAGGTMEGAINEAKGADIASAATCNIAAATGNYVRITGTSTISSFGTAQAGTVRRLRFSAALTLTHNATSMILQGGTSFTTVPGDIYEFTSEGGGNWRQTGYMPASGKYNPVIASATVVGGVKAGTGVTIAADGTITVPGQFTQSLTTNGWQKLPSGLIMQWGYATLSPSTPQTITLPIAFPSAGLAVFVSPNATNASGPSDDYQGVASFINNSSISLTSGMYGGSCAFNWLAIGH